MLSMARIPLIAEKLGVSVEYLLGFESKKQINIGLEKEILQNLKN